MRLTAIAAALAAATLAACGDKPPQPRVDAQPAAAGGTSATGGTTSSSTGQTSKEERKDAANPVQQQVDPKQKEQQRDFQMRGDQQGPKSAETQPKN